MDLFRGFFVDEQPVMMEFRINRGRGDRFSYKTEVLVPGRHGAHAI